MADYFKERERDVNVRLREIRDTLPEFAEEFSWASSRRPPR